MSTLNEVKPADLNASHLGRRVRVTQRTRIVEGYLDRVEHSAELIEETRMCDSEPNYVLGRVATELNVGGVSITIGPLTIATVEVSA